MRAEMKKAVVCVVSGMLFGLMLTDPAAAADVAAPAAGSQMMSPFQFIFSTVQFFLIGFFVYFWLAIRPGQLREDERKKFISELKKNDDVMTTGGIFGKVVSLKDDSATIDVGGGVKVRVHLDHITSLPPILPGGARSSTPADSASGALRLQVPTQKTSE